MSSPEFLLQAVYSRWASRHGVQLSFHKPTDDKGSCPTHARELSGSTRMWVATAVFRRHPTGCEVTRNKKKFVGHNRKSPRSLLQFTRTHERA